MKTATKIHPLRLARVTMGLTQLELALLINTSDSRISSVERGYALLNAAEMHHCAKFFNVTVDELFPKTLRETPDAVERRGRRALASKATKPTQAASSRTSRTGGRA